MRGKQIGRIFRALKLLSRPTGARIAEFEQELCCDRRSVYRMLETLQEMGFPLYDEQSPLGREKIWKLSEEYVLKMPNITLPQVDISWSEVFALQMMRSQDEVFRDTEIASAADRALGKLGVLLPQDLAEKLSRLKGLCTPLDKFSKDYSEKGEIIDALTEAALVQRVCRLGYDSFSKGREVSFPAGPLTFFEDKGGLYLFVYSTEYDNVRVLAVERIQKVELTDDSFETPEDFDPEAMLQTAFDITFEEPVNVRVWVSAKQARYLLQRRFFSNQKVEQNPDGSIILDFEASGWFDIKQWILGLGAEAKVLAPEKLRQDLADEVKRMAENLKK